MTLAWHDVAVKPEFQNLSDSQKSDAANQYFNQVVAPHVHQSEIGNASSQFSQFSGFQIGTVSPQPPMTIGMSGADARGGYVEPHHNFGEMGAIPSADGGIHTQQFPTPRQPKQSELSKVAISGVSQGLKAHADAAQTLGLNDLANAITGQNVDAVKWWATQVAQNNPDTEAGRIISGALGLLTETPLFMPGSAIGKGAAIGLSKVAPKVATELAPAIQAAGSFGGEAAIRGEPIKDVGKQALMGAAVGAAGKLSGQALAGASKPIQALGATVAETAALTGSGSALNDQPITGQSLGETIATLAALKIAHKALSKVTAEPPLPEASDAEKKALEASQASQSNEIQRSMEKQAKTLIGIVDRMKQHGEVIHPDVEKDYNDAHALLVKPTTIITATAIDDAAAATKVRENKLAELDKKHIETSKAFIQLADSMTTGGAQLPPDMEAKYKQAKAALNAKGKEQKVEQHPKNEKGGEQPQAIESPMTKPIGTAMPKSAEVLLSTKQTVPEQVAPVLKPTDYNLTKMGNIRAFKSIESAKRYAKGAEVVPHPEKSGKFAIKVAEGVKEGYTYSYETVKGSVSEGGGREDIQDGDRKTAKVSRKVKLQKTGKIKSGLDKIFTSADLAHVMAGLRKNAQEHFSIVVTNKNGKIINIINHSVGKTSSTQVEPTAIVSTVASIKNARTIWIAHNHPSNTAKLSDEDINMADRIRNLIKPIGVNVGDIIAVTPSAKFASSSSYNDKIPPLSRNKELPTSERKFVGAGQHKPMNNSDDLKVLMKRLNPKNKEGILIANHANRPTTFLEFTKEQMITLKNKTGTNAKKLLTAIHEGNGKSLFAVVSGKSDAELSNLHSFSNAFDLRMLDAIDRETGDSLAETNAMPYNVGSNVFYSNPFANPELYRKAGKFSKDIAKSTYEAVKKSAVGDAVKDIHRVTSTHKAFTSMDRIIGDLTGTEQITNLILRDFSRNINKLLPKERQVAITHYMQAGGDVAKLKRQAAEVDKKYRKGFEAATNLTDAEKSIADFLRKEMDTDWKDANEAGIIDSYVENYVKGMWDFSTNKARQFISSSGILNAKPSETRQKIFDSYFDGIQKGYTPKDLRIGFLFVSHRESIRGAIAARKSLKDLMKAEVDGHRVIIVGGVGHPIEGDKGSAFLVKPNAGKIDYNNYKKIDHPAMKRWKWLNTGVEGSPILMQGDMYVYTGSKSGKSPYDRLNGILGTSFIRNAEVPDYIPVIGGTRPGDALLKLGGFVKGTILIGPFHQFHLGEHAIFHRVNPFNPPKIDFTNKDEEQLVKNGLMVHSQKGNIEFAEGVASGGALHMADRAFSKTLEKAGIKYDPILQRYQDYLFGDYIPRLKMAMAKHAMVRAKEYYAKDLASGKMTNNQLIANVARQSNAAFGEQNYKFIGRNKTVQDGLRLLLLAPDFLESRFKFAGQAVTKGGREQLTALIFGAVVMASTAQMVNAMFGDKKDPSKKGVANRMHWDKPFSVVIDGREYTPRSVVGDMFHLFEDTRGFFYYRLNPIYGRSLTEILTGKNQYGIKETSEDAMKNILKSYIPIPLQGFAKRHTGEDKLDTIIHALFKSIGISNFETKTDFEREVSNINFGHISIGGRSEEQKRRYKAYIDIMDRYDTGDLSTISDVRIAAKKSNIILSRQKLKRIRQSRIKTERSKVLMLKERMIHFSADEMMGLWDKMDDMEKKTFRSFIKGKIDRSRTMTEIDKRESLRKLGS